MIKLTVEDLTHLGGPMGTEYTTVIATHVLENLSDVRPFILRKYKKRDKRIAEQLPSKIVLGRFYDCLSTGFLAEKLKIEKV